MPITKQKRKTRKHIPSLGKSVSGYISKRTRQKWAMETFMKKYQRMQIQQQEEKTRRELAGLQEETPRESEFRFELSESIRRKERKARRDFRKGKRPLKELTYEEVIAVQNKVQENLEEKWHEEDKLKSGNSEEE